MQGLLELSEEQLQDLEMLRRIYLIKRAGLAKERKMLVHQAVRSLSHAEDTVPLPGHTRVSSYDCYWCCKAVDDLDRSERRCKTAANV
jgi:hypothetical protein